MTTVDDWTELDETDALDNELAKDKARVTKDRVTPKADPTCIVCGKPLEWKGTGFRPKYCADDKPTRHDKILAEDEKPKPRANPAVNRAIISIELLYRLGGTGLAMTVAPRLGTSIVADREKLAESYRMLLETNKAVRDWFAETEKKAAWLPILIVHADLVVNTVMSAQMEKQTRQQAAQQTEEDAPPVYTGWTDAPPPRPDGA